MATKNAPSKYDCYHNAEPDEPMFILLARDISAPCLTDLWAILREIAGDGSTKNYERAFSILREAIAVMRQSKKPPADEDKMKEARSCAEAMRDWKKRKDATQ
jgi:hypothetical protein